MKENKMQRKESDLTQDVGDDPVCVGTHTHTNIHMVLLQEDAQDCVAIESKASET